MEFITKKWNMAILCLSAIFSFLVYLTYFSYFLLRDFNHNRNSISVKWFPYPNIWIIKTVQSTNTIYLLSCLFISNENYSEQQIFLPNFNRNFCSKPSNTSKRKHLSQKILAKELTICKIIINMSRQKSGDWNELEKFENHTLKYCLF